MENRVYRIVLFLLLLLVPLSIKAENLTIDGDESNKCPKEITIKDDISFEAIEEMIESDGTINIEKLSTFFTDNTKDEIIRASSGKDAELKGGTYCPIYCVEENVFKFPGYSPVTNSGNHFNWVIGDTDESILSGLTVKLNGIKVCTAAVDLNKWIDAYLDNIEKIKQIVLKMPSVVKPNCTPDPGTYKGGVCAYIDTGKTRSVGFDVSAKETLSSTSESDAFTDHFLNIFGHAPEENHFSGSNLYYYLAGNFRGRDNHNGTFLDLQTDAIVTMNNGDLSVLSAPINNPYGREFVRTITAIGNMTSWNGTVTEYQRKCCWWQFNTSKSPIYNELNLSGEVRRISSLIDADDIQNTEYYKESDCRKVYIGEAGNEYTNVYSCNGANYSEAPSVVPGGYYCPTGFTMLGRSCYNAERDVTINRLKHPNSYRCNGEKIEDTDPDAKRCNYSPYKRVCTEGYGDLELSAGNKIASEISGGGGGCVPGGVRYCADSRYALAADNNCYLKDTDTLMDLISKIDGLFFELQNCKKVLENFDYTLTTSIDVLFNETDDAEVYKTNSNSSPNNGTKNNLEQIEEKKGSSEIFTSEKSLVSETFTFNGQTYTISSTGVPIIMCNVYQSVKYCNAIQTTALNDYWYDFYGKVYYAKYQYKLDSSFYKWVLLPNGTSVSIDPCSSASNEYCKYGRYIDVGYANYPVHYNTSGGLYEGLNLKIKTLGYNNNLYNRYNTQINNYNLSLDDRSISGGNNTNTLFHDCYYKVKEGSPYCPTGGCSTENTDDDDLGSVRLIYRPISLENPFPAMSGIGRNTGSNWCTINSTDKSENCKNNNTNKNVNNYILNNRNTEGSDIYSKEPMYEIKLTPYIIKKIREYNDSTNYDDYNLFCNLGTIDKELQGRECRSHFVVGGMEESGLPTFADKFTDRCGMNDDFEYCDKLDGYER